MHVQLNNAKMNQIRLELISGYVKPHFGRGELADLKLGLIQFADFTDWETTGEANEGFDVTTTDGVNFHLKHWYTNLEETLTLEELKCKVNEDRFTMKHSCDGIKNYTDELLFKNLSKLIKGVPTDEIALQNWAHVNQVSLFVREYWADTSYFIEQANILIDFINKYEILPYKLNVKLNEDGTFYSITDDEEGNYNSYMHLYFILDKISNMFYDAE